MDNQEETAALVINQEEQPSKKEKKRRTSRRKLKPSSKNSTVKSAAVSQLLLSLLQVPPKSVHGALTSVLLENVPEFSGGVLPLHQAIRSFERNNNIIFVLPPDDINFDNGQYLEKLVEYLGLECTPSLLACLDAATMVTHYNTV